VEKACQRCGGRCCRYFCFQIDAPESFRQFEDVRWFLFHKGTTIHVEDNGDWYISIANRCTALDADGRCRAYDDRPLICRKYDPADCDFSAGNYGYAMTFRTPAELEAHAREVLGPKRYEKAKAQAHAKIARKQARRRRRTKRPRARPRSAGS